MHDDARRALLRGRTFRWTAEDDTSGYFAAEVVGEQVRFWRWSHIHGEGRLELGEQSAEAVSRGETPVPVPAVVRAQILAAIGAP